MTHKHACVPCRTRACTVLTCKIHQSVSGSNSPTLLENCLRQPTVQSSPTAANATLSRSTFAVHICIGFRADTYEVPRSHAVIRVHAIHQTGKETCTIGRLDDWPTKSFFGYTTTRQRRMGKIACYLRMCTSCLRVVDAPGSVQSFCGCTFVG